MSQQLRNWPGGIPPQIRPHHTGDLSIGEVKEEVKGWLLFVKENWVPRDRDDNDDEYELRQRRALVEQWASASQEFRDSFQNRAPIGLPGTEGRRPPSDQVEGLRYPAEALEQLRETSQPCDSNRVISLAPVDASHPVNRARWVKFAILLYRYDFISGHCLGDNYMPATVKLNAASISSEPPTVVDFLPWLDLESARFGSIYLTRTGTVLYLGALHNHMLVDEEGLRTGRLTLVDYEINGAIKDCALLRPFNMYNAYLGFDNGQTISDVRVKMGGHKLHNQPMDMDLPILDILDHQKVAQQLVVDMDVCNREDWEKDVERYAPGYLALEAAGHGLDYDLNRLVEPSEIENVKKDVLKRLAAGSDPRITIFPPFTHDV